MKQIKINGGRTLSGEIKIGGAKNSVVALIPASLLASGNSEITNVPNITDKDALFEILELLNVDASMTKSTVFINSENMINHSIPEKLTCKLRASYYFMGVLLSKYHYVEINLPGGCNIGARPIDLHLKGFSALGAEVIYDEDEYKYIIKADKLVGTIVDLDFASVGATINIMYAAVMAKGTTEIRNAAKETEIINIAEYLNKMGANITGAGTEKIIIKGVEKLTSANIKVLPDRIEAGTYIIAGALLGKDLVISGVIPEHIEALLQKLEKMSVKFKIDGDKIKISKAEKLAPVNITTGVYPGFPTDLGQPMSVMLTQTNGTCYFEETIYENRMQHIEYLNKMGANIVLKDNTHCIINGPTKLTGAKINATDLRGGAALVLAGLIAEGTTTIINIEYILRGYENLITKLNNVGADISIIDE